ncbi:MAG: ABC transporter substrate-binding protein [Hyphomicrobiaceae bacterium]|nr:ABC transporter substrate-binding protein [Hyphomicrobiaceae bacterium]
MKRHLARIAALFALTLSANFFALWADRALADTADAAAAKYSIAVFVSEPKDRCFYSGRVAAMKYFVQQRIDELNALPEFADRRLRADVYNDYRDNDAAIANVKKAMDDPNTLAMIGLSGSSRGKAVFEALGEELSKRNIPFITDQSVTGSLAPYANAFTMRPSQESERVPVIMRFLQDGKYARPAFLGIQDNPASAELARLLGDNLGKEAPLVSEHMIPVTDGEPSMMDLKAAVQSIKSKDADIVLVLLGSTAMEAFLKEATAAQLRSQVFMLTESDRVFHSQAAKDFGTALYQLGWSTLPFVYNSRLRRDMLDDATSQWLFADKKNGSAPGWNDASCKVPPEGIPTNPLDPVNLNNVARGANYGDMVGLVGEVAKLSPPETMLSELRARVVEALSSQYTTGHGAYRGKFDDWSFHPLGRTASKSPLILVKGRGIESKRLAPRQYVKMRNDALREIRTIYMDIDVTRLYRIDDDEKSFFAEFFLTMNADSGVPVSSINFSNAFFDAEEGGQKITIQPLNESGGGGIYPDDVRIYKVTGKFMSRPDFWRYPFDTQLFPIELKPKDGDAAFIIQPPPATLRDRVIQTDGWVLRDQYVGYDQDYIPVTDARSDSKSIVPFYKAEFGYIMQREVTDYYLRVVIPLIFILIVAFLSIFIPREHFEAIVTIQVTALLSAVALYFSIPKVGTDTATVSDRIFLVDYLAVSVMIAISIARVNPMLRKAPGVDGLLKVLHILGTPILIGVMAYYLANIHLSQQAQVWYGQDAEVSDSDSGNGK